MSEKFRCGESEAPLELTADCGRMTCHSEVGNRRVITSGLPKTRPERRVPLRTTPLPDQKVGQPYVLDADLPTVEDICGACRIDRCQGIQISRRNSGRSLRPKINVRCQQVGISPAGQAIGSRPTCGFLCWSPRNRIHMTEDTPMYPQSHSVFYMVATTSSKTRQGRPYPGPTNEG